MNVELVVFLPTYNERENLPLVVERLFGLGLDLFILVVDDNSPDGTGEIGDRLAEKHADRMRIIHREGPRGRGLAGIVGLREASAMDCRFVVEMDADASHDPGELPRLLEIAQDADLVIGSRYVEGGTAENFGLLRTLNSKVAKFLTVLFLGLRYTDPTSGYRVYRREILLPLPWDRMISPGPSIVEETLYYIKRNGARIVETPIAYRDRHKGSSKITIGIILRWIMTLMRIRWTAARN
ncbi:MAG: polyprenol monophosphomannose synthase [Candidatus Omnitrophica bacterium]|nr:polyprenol monophosphomannose synthase [Candidatus Omnitrophota bacterium]